MIRVSLAAALCLAAASALAQDPGRDAYATNCSACHQPTGQGIKGAFPALAGDPFVDGAPAPVIAVVLTGRGGMPPFKAGLTDTQIAAAVSYIRSAWRNAAPAVTPAAVAVVRAGAATQ
jgi:mono/diheme cytochrome c family protein